MREVGHQGNVVFLNNRELTAEAMEACKSLFINPTDLLPVRQEPSKEFESSQTAQRRAVEGRLSKSIQRLRETHEERRRQSKKLSEVVEKVVEVAEYIKLQQLVATQPNPVTARPPLAVGSFAVASSLQRLRQQMLRTTITARMGESNWESSMTAD